MSLVHVKVQYNGFMREIWDLENLLYNSSGISQIPRKQKIYELSKVWQVVTIKILKKNKFDTHVQHSGKTDWHVFIPPTLKKLRGHIWFGSVHAVSQSDSQSVCL